MPDSVCHESVDRNISIKMEITWGRNSKYDLEFSIIDNIGLI